MGEPPARPFLIGVAGGSSSGKTTVAERLAEMAGERHVALIKLDSYYVDLGDRPRDERHRAAAGQRAGHDHRLTSGGQRVGGGVLDAPPGLGERPRLPVAIDE